MILTGDGAMFLNKQQQATPKLERQVAMPGAAADEAARAVASAMAR